MKTKNLLFVILISGFYFSNVKAQQQPICVNDTVTMNGGYSINLIRPYLNDINIPAGQGRLDTLKHLGSHQIKSMTVDSMGNIFDLEYYYPDMGVDSFLYVMHINGYPNLKDSAKVFVNINYYYIPQADTFETTFYKAIVYADGGLFEDRQNALPGFFIPKDSGTATIFASAIWVGGKVNNTVQVSEITYNNYLNSLTRPGPITDSADWTTQEEIKWNRFWYLTSWDVSQFKLHYNDPNYTIPEAILDWPAHGDTTKGQEYNLAPWVDVDSDGIYNPHNGDYPLLKGDQNLYFIYHSIDSGALPVNIQVMLYNVRCKNKCFQQSILADITVSNAGQQNIDSTFIGDWTDVDLGAAFDDYLGSDVMRSTYYFYNGAYGFGNHPPAQGITFLRGAKLDNDGSDNAFGVGANETVNGYGFGDGIVDNEYWGMQYFTYSHIIGGNPVDKILSYYYDYLNRDTFAYRFMFPGYSDTAYWYGSGGIPYTPWSEDSAGNTPGDRRGVASTGPFTLQPGEKRTITVAYVYGRDLNDTTSQAGVNAMLQNVDSLHYYYDLNYKPCGGNFTGIVQTSPQLHVAVYPNPFRQNIEIFTGKAAPYTAALYDISGRLLLKKQFNQSHFTLQTNNLPKGIYILKVRSPQSEKTFKMVK